MFYENIHGKWNKVIKLLGLDENMKKHVSVDYNSSSDSENVIQCNKNERI